MADIIPFRSRSDKAKDKIRKELQAYERFENERWKQQERNNASDFDALSMDNDNADVWEKEQSIAQKEARKEQMQNQEKHSPSPMDIKDDIPLEEWEWLADWIASEKKKDDE